MCFFGPKMAVFGPKLQFLKLRSATCESRSRPPPSSFALKLCVIVLHTHRYHAPKFQPNPKHHDGVLIFTHFACAAASLLLAACLLAAKPGRSTLDTKKGYKTKTSSTSSVTLTLTKIGRFSSLRSMRGPAPAPPLNNKTPAVATDCLVCAPPCVCTPLCVDRQTTPCFGFLFA